MEGKVTYSEALKLELVERVERNHAVYRERFVNGNRVAANSVAGISTIKEANRFPDKREVFPPAGKDNGQGTGT